MSGVFKAIGKVFKSVVKIVKKVALPALMIGAVVLTGGAALGLLPAVGTVLGGLGLSAGLTAVLTGAVTAGALGAGIGGLTAAISGKNILKGATTGFVGGAISGGLLGAISPSSIGSMGIFGGSPITAGASSTGLETLGASKAADGLLGVASAGDVGAVAPAAVPFSADLAGAPVADAAGTAADATSSAFAAPTYGATASAPSGGFYAEAASSPPPGFGGSAAPSGGAASGLPPGFGGGSGVSTTSFGSPIGPGTYLDRAAAVAHSGGLLNSATTPLLMQTIGSAVSGLGQGAAASQQAKDAAAARRFEADRVAFNYGYQNTYPTNSKGQVSNDADPTGQHPWYHYASAVANRPNPPTQQQPRGYYAISGNQVVFVPTGG